MVGRGLVPRHIVRGDKPPAYPDNYVRTPLYPPACSLKLYLDSFFYFITRYPPSTVASQTGHSPIFDIVPRPSALRACGGWSFRGGNKTGTAADGTGESLDRPATVAVGAASVRRLDLDYTFSSANATSGELRHDPEGVFTLASTEGAGNDFHLLPGSLPILN